MNVAGQHAKRNIAGQFVQGSHYSGAPRMFQDIGSFQAIIDAYFAERQAKDEPFTMHGLARALDCDRSTLMRYEDVYADAEPFGNAIKRARERVAEWTETRLHTKGFHPAGPIFSLKNNFGWSDVQVVQHQGAVLMGVLTAEDVRQALVPGLPIAQIPSNNEDAPALDIEALSPVVETAIALSPVHEVAVTVDSGEAKATPIEGVSPHRIL